MLSIQRTAFVLVCVATAILALKGIFARLALDTGLSVAAVLFLRALFAVPLFWAVLRWRQMKTKGEDTGTKVNAPVERRDIWLALACGNLFTIATVLDIYVLSFMDVGVSRAILFTFPLFVQLLGMLHERRRPQQREIVTFVTAYAGLMLMLGILDGGELRVPLVGALCVLCSAASYGAYLYYGRNIALRLGSNRFTLLSNSSTLLVFVLIAPFVVAEADFQMTLQGLGWIACLVVFSTVIPFLLLFEGMRNIEAAQATLISLASPVISLSLAAYLFGERVTGLQMLGFVLVLLGVSFLKLPNPFLKKPKAD